MAKIHRVIISFPHESYFYKSTHSFCVSGKDLKALEQWVKKRFSGRGKIKVGSFNGQVRSP